jgi:Immunoglobulin I-set domain
MKLKYILTYLAAVLLSASSASAQTTLAKWTFETSQPGVVDMPATPGAGVWITNIASEIGSGIASGFHKGSATYSSPVGNGSSHSFSSATWTNVGDCYQFAISTVGFQSISVSWNQVVSSFAPTNFSLLYSTDGATFTPFASYLVSSSVSFSSGTSNSTATVNFLENLSAITALNNATTAYFRISLASLTDVGGTNATTSGTSRVDNFVVAAAGGAGPAVIVTQPQPVNTFFGNTASLSVLAAGQTPVSYQWYYPNLNTPLVDGPSGFGSGQTAGTISGSTNAMLTLASIDPGQAGPYQVIVSNALGTATSIVAQVTVSIRTPIVTNIAYLRTLQTTNWTPSDTTNLYTVTGTVTTPFNMSASTSSEFFIQDASGEGIAVFIGGGSFTPAQGDSVQVTGPMGQFDGLLELSLSVSNPSHTVTDLSSGNPLPAPKFFDFSSLTNIPYVETNIEGSLVIVSNVFIQQTNLNVGFVSGADYSMTNVNGRLLNLFINANASDVIASSVPVFASSVTGVFDQFTTSIPATNSYELDFLQYANLVPGTTASIPFTLQTVGTNAVLTWNATLFSLQSATNVSGPYTTISGATSPYTDPLTNAANFYRLAH